MSDKNVMSVESLILHYRTVRGAVRAVDGVSFALPKGKTIAVVGESGCGKTSLASAITAILPVNVERYEGSVFLEDGVDVTKMSEDERRQKIRWNVISTVFQGAMNALNPVYEVGYQVAEPLIVHKKMKKEDAMDEAKNALSLVGLPSDFLKRYPHQLSGGMKQRVMIAMALVLRPKIVILDEPTSALDVITQANIMNLLKKLKWDLNLSYIFITHDLALASELADIVAVMYAGRIVERASSEKFFTRPEHPYSQKLMQSVPTLRSKKELEYIPGAPPDLIYPPPGCRFHPRCPYAMDVCKEKVPELRELNPDHVVYCWLHQ